MPHLILSSIVLVAAPSTGALLTQWNWQPSVLLGILLLGFGNGGVVWAERTVSSGLTAVLVSTAPFWMVGIEALTPDGDALTRRHVVGLLVGFAGIVVLVWPEIHMGGSGRPFLGGVVAAQLACVGWAVGSTYARRHAREENVLATAAFEMLFGGLVLLALGSLRNEWAVFAFNTRTASALAYLTFAQQKAWSLTLCMNLHGSAPSSRSSQKEERLPWAA